jgi:hypothetical protein
MNAHWRWIAAFAALSLAACTGGNPNSKAVMLLVDTSGTYASEFGQAQRIVNYLLGTLDSGDSFAVAEINSESFTEKNIVVRATFDTRPSTANAQKRSVLDATQKFVDSIAKGSAKTDITGGVLQALEYVREVDATNKIVLLFSDLQEDLQTRQIRDFPIDFNGVRVVAVNVTKLRSDNIDPRDYAERQEHWKQRVEAGGGQWQVVNDLDRLQSVLL